MNWRFVVGQKALVLAERMQKADNHTLSEDDLAFRESIESCELFVSEFDHRAHLRLAYIYLLESDPETAFERIRKAITNILNHNDVDPAKYHETITKAWVLAVQLFMRRSGTVQSSEHFIELNPRLLDSKIMLTHYSEEHLFSDEARMAFVEPDLDPIPRDEKP